MRLSISILLLLVSTFLFAQKKAIPYPHLSPLEKTQIKIALVDIKLAYSKPSMRGRKIFGELEPYGDLWRTGANKNIKLSFSESVIINSKTIEAGTYTIFTRPEEEEWTIYLYDHIDYYGVPKGIDTLNIITEFKVQPKHLTDVVETMDIAFTNLTYGSGDIEIKWEQTLVSIPFEVPYPTIIEDVLADQRETLASDYAYAANIFLNKKKDKDKAMEYLDKSISTRLDGSTFDQWLVNLKKKDLGLPWAHLMKSEMYAARNNFPKAIEQANLSIKIAEVVGSNYYKKENTANLKKWKMK